MQRGSTINPSRAAAVTPCCTPKAPPQTTTCSQAPPAARLVSLTNAVAASSSSSSSAHLDCQAGHSLHASGHLILVLQSGHDLQGGEGGQYTRWTREGRGEVKVILGKAGGNKHVLAHNCWACRNHPTPAPPTTAEGGEVQRRHQQAVVTEWCCFCVVPCPASQTPRPPPAPCTCMVPHNGTAQHRDTHTIRWVCWAGSGGLRRQKREGGQYERHEAARGGSTIALQLGPA